MTPELQGNIDSQMSSLSTISCYCINI